MTKDLIPYIVISSSKNAMNKRQMQTKWNNAIPNMADCIDYQLELMEKRFSKFEDAGDLKTAAAIALEYDTWVQCDEGEEYNALVLDYIEIN